MRNSIIDKGDCGLTLMLLIGWLILLLKILNKKVEDKSCLNDAQRQLTWMSRKSKIGARIISIIKG